MLLRVLALAAAAAAASPGLVFQCAEPTCANYSLVDGAGATLLASVGPLAVRVADAWATEANGGLARVAPPVAWEGADALFGAFDAINVSLALRAVDPAAVALVLTAKTYREADGAAGAVVFTTSFPLGLSVAPTATRDDVVVNGWPALAADRARLPYASSWSGSFMSATVGTLSSGPIGGPAVFFADASGGAASVGTVVGSALGGWKASSAGPGRGEIVGDDDGAGAADARDGAWTPGVPTTITTIPAGYAASTLLHATRGGVNEGVYAWGAALRAWTGATDARDVADVTIEKIGYQTDNGARVGDEAEALPPSGTRPTTARTTASARATARTSCCARWTSSRRSACRWAT